MISTPFGGKVEKVKESMNRIRNKPVACRPPRGKGRGPAPSNCLVAGVAPTVTAAAAGVGSSRPAVTGGRALGGGGGAGGGDGPRVLEESGCTHAAF